jgi:uncharacterized protein YuzE
VKTTDYFRYRRRSRDRAWIKDEWIERVIQNPLRRVVQADGRIRLWAAIPEANGLFLRVILLADGRDGSQRLLRSRLSPMKIKYFKDTDTLHIELRDTEVVETRDLDENTQVDLDAQGQLCAITIEHASTRTDVPNISFEQVAV